MVLSSFTGIVFATETPVSYNLSDIVVNGGGLPGFSPDTTDYTIFVPYVYEANNFDNFPMPTVSAAVGDSRADFEIEYPVAENAQDNAVIKIYVNDAGSDIDVDPEKTYTLTLKTVGRNLFSDGGFETNAKTSYQQGNNGPLTWDIVENDTGAGSKVLKANGGIDSNGFGAALRTYSATNLAPGKTYLNGFMVKLDPEITEHPSNLFLAGVVAGYDDTTQRRQQFAGNYFKLSTGENMAKSLTLTDSWEKYVAVVASTRDANVRIGVSMGSSSYSTTSRPQTYFLYDDMYLGELVIANAEITDNDSYSVRNLLLPDEETTLTLDLSLENQYGSSNGLENVQVEWELLEAPDEGVTFDADTQEITIADDAEAGKVVVEATITPQWTGAAQTTVKTRYNLVLEPANEEDRLPKAKKVVATGAVGTGLTLYGDYDFWSPVSAGKGECTYQWYYSTTGGEPFTIIPGAEAETYTVEEEYSNYFIFFEVTPVDSDGRQGAPVKSNALRQPVAPVAKNIKITGEMSVGETLTGSYQFHDDNGDGEGESTFRWIRVEEDGTLTELLTDTGNAESGSTYTVTAEDMYCYLIFEVTPKSAASPVGNTPFQSRRYLCAPNSVLYGLTDVEVNGGGIKDFISSTTEYEIVLPYSYRENDLITIPRPLVTATTVNEDATTSVRYPTEIADGEEIFIDVKDSEGDVRNTYTLTIRTVGQNMFPDGGFETEEISAYIDGEFNELIRNGKGTIVADATGAGEKVFKGSGAVDSNGFVPKLFYNGTIGGRRGVYISPNKTYISAFMAKLDPESPNTEETFAPAVVSPGLNTLIASDSPYRRKSFTKSYYTKEGYATADPFKLKADWNTFVTFFNTNSLDTDVRVGVNLTSNNKVNEIYYMYDEMYLGELVIADMNIVDQDGNAEGTMSVPDSNASVYLAATVNNQYGNVLGLDSASAPITWELLTTSNSGVTFDAQNKRIDITSEAEPGVIIVEATATPTYAGRAQEYFKKRYKLTIEPVESSYTPKAKNVTAEGIVRDGQVLTADYDFYSYDSVEGESEFQWYCSTSATGVFSPISGATDTTYTVDTAHENLYICFEVIPVDAMDRRGASVRSRVLQRPTAPEVLDITVSGDMIVGTLISADYDYFDANGDSEGTSSYRWLRSTTQNGTYTPIGGATSKSYRLTTDDIDCYLKFEVTPKNSVEPRTGTPTPSRAYLGPARATVENVKISDKGSGIYTASYTYKHPHNYSEGATICNWYLNDELIATDIKVRLDSGNKGTLKLEVIPICLSKPYEGVASSTTKKISSGGGGGGGGGGSSSGISVPKDAYEDTTTGIVPLPEVPEAEQKPETSVTPVTPVTPQEHWASEAVKFVLENNIMENKAENDFAYDELVTRAEFVSYIIRGLGAEEVPYKGEFGDVTAEDSFANELQAAVEIGMISKDTNFYPDRHVSREEVCKILLFALGEETCQEEDVTAEFQSLTDYTNISQWAIGFVRKAMKIGMMKGVGNNVFDPRGNVTRAQTAMLVLRTAQYSTAE